MRRAPHPPHRSGHLLGGLADVVDAIPTLSIMMGWRSFGPAFRAALARRLDRVGKVLTGMCTDKAEVVSPDRCFRPDR
jgi:hypothetical protein